MPVYSNLNLDYAALGLGRRIRDLRKEKGWTLHDLASRLSLSIASLSTIENEKAALDLERLVEICEALGVRPDALFPRSRSTHYHICRRTELEAASAAVLKIVDQTNGALTDYHNLLQPLADVFVGKHFEPFHIEIQPIRDEDLQFICHHHEEFFFVLRGDVECLLKTPDGLVRQVLSPGDCMYFWSYLPHCLRSLGPQSAASVHLLYSAHGATDSERANAERGDIIYFRDVSNRSLTEQIAGKMTALRQARGMSLADFARELEIGVRQLTEIERAHKPVSIKFLLRVCRKFRKPLEYFLASTLVDRPFQSVLRASEIPALPVRSRRLFEPGTGSKYEFRPLAGGFPKRGMHPYYVKVSGAEEVDARLHEHYGQEFVYVLNGEITLQTVQDNQRISVRLSAGDSCFIDSAVPHRFIGAGLNPYEKSSAELIDVFWSGLGESYLFLDAPAEPAEVVALDLAGSTSPSAIDRASAAAPLRRA